MATVLGVRKGGAQPHCVLCVHVSQNSCATSAVPRVRARTASGEPRIQSTQCDMGEWTCMYVCWVCLVTEREGHTPPRKTQDDATGISHCFI